MKELPESVVCRSLQTMDFGDSNFDVGETLRDMLVDLEKQIAATDELRHKKASALIQELLNLPSDSAPTFIDEIHLAIFG